jgi:hypothetical protein
MKRNKTIIKKAINLKEARGRKNYKGKRKQI